MFFFQIIYFTSILFITLFSLIIFVDILMNNSYSNYFSYEIEYNYNFIQVKDKTQMKIGNPRKTKYLIVIIVFVSHIDSQFFLLLYIFCVKVRNNQKT